jgi:hypothetical protein
MHNEYRGFHKHWQIINHLIYVLIVYDYCHSNASKLKQEYNVKIMLSDMRRSTGKKSAEHIIRPIKVISASHDQT